MLYRNAFSAAGTAVCFTRTLAIPHPTPYTAEWDTPLLLKLSAIGFSNREWQRTSRQQLAGLKRRDGTLDELLHHRQAFGGEGRE